MHFSQKFTKTHSNACNISCGNATIQNGLFQLIVKTSYNSAAILIFSNLDILYNFITAVLYLLFIDTLYLNCASRSKVYKKAFKRTFLDSCSRSTFSLSLSLRFVKLWYTSVDQHGSKLLSDQPLALLFPWCGLIEDRKKIRTVF